jgi:hypothetical protein
MAEDGALGCEYRMKKVSHLPRVELGECESAPRQSGVTPNWCTPLLTDLLNDYQVI